MSIMSAVECLAAKRTVLDIWKGTAGLAVAQEALRLQPHPGSLTAEALRDTIRRHLTASEVFHVTADMVNLAEGASMSMPHLPLRVDDPPTGCGFLVLDRPLLVPEGVQVDYETPDGVAGMIGVSALLWGPATDPATGRPGLAVLPLIDWWRLRERVQTNVRESARLNKDLADLDRRLVETGRLVAEESTDPAKVAEAWEQVRRAEERIAAEPEKAKEEHARAARMLRIAESYPGSRFVPAFGGIEWWPWDSTPSERFTGPATQHWTRVLLTMWSLMAQPLVGAVREAAPRSEVKRLRRADLADSGVTVVVLRRKVAPAPLPGERLVEWSHRWVVRGHWRMQPYGDGSVRRIYIAPFVKGPEGKPLRAAERVYELSR